MKPVLIQGDKHIITDIPVHLKRNYHVFVVCGAARFEFIICKIHSIGMSQLALGRGFDPRIEQLCPINSVVRVRVL